MPLNAVAEKSELNRPPYNTLSQKVWDGLYMCGAQASLPDIRKAMRKLGHTCPHNQKLVSTLWNLQRGGYAEKVGGFGEQIWRVSQQRTVPMSEIIARIETDLQLLKQMA